MEASCRDGSGCLHAQSGIRRETGGVLDETTGSLGETSGFLGEAGRSLDEITGFLKSPAGPRVVEPATTQPGGRSAKSRPAGRRCDFAQPAGRGGESTARRSRLRRRGRSTETAKPQPADRARDVAAGSSELEVVDCGRSADADRHRVDGGLEALPGKHAAADRDLEAGKPSIADDPCAGMEAQVLGAGPAP